ncbi:MAG: hypothetical protein U9P44_03670 [archaeon]|nr:hypothetical protein [archaeon]
MDKNMHISVVLPVYDEAGNLEKLNRCIMLNLYFFASDISSASLSAI